MLGDYPIEVVLLATDLQASRDFHVQKIGLEIVRETEYSVWFKCGTEVALLQPGHLCQATLRYL